MLIVISPAKTLDFESKPVTKQHSQPAYLDDSAELVDALRELSPPQIERLMGISPKLADLNFGRYLNWETPFTESNAKQAALAFKGDVYTGLEAEAFKAPDFKFAQKHLRILSGLYGVLRPLDLIQPYRLEMGVKFKNPRGDNLYKFWGEQLTQDINAQLKKNKSQALLNLASNEYFKSLQPKALEVPVVAPAFKEFKNGQYKIISFFAKKARGLMTAYVIKNRITAIDDIASFDLDGYKYNKKLSSESVPVFTRKQT